jgi:hypothetical protein
LDAGARVHLGAGEVGDPDRYAADLDRVAVADMGDVAVNPEAGGRGFAPACRAGNSARRHVPANRSQRDDEGERPQLVPLAPQACTRHDAGAECG